MNKHAFAFALLGLALLAGCARGGSGIVPASTQAVGGEEQPQSIIVHGNFTEYTLPAGARPVDFTKGPSNTLWFDQNAGFASGFRLYRFTESTGVVGTFTKGAPWTVLSTPLAIGSLIYFITLNPNGPGENPEYLSHSTFAGALSTGPQIASDDEIPGGHIALGSDGRIWFPFCVQTCSSYESGDGITSTSTAGVGGFSAAFPDFQANFITPGPLGYLYVTASFNNALPPPPPGNHDSAVFVVSTSGRIVHKFLLPNGSAPWGIVTGSDHNLWIAEPGINKIARMTPSGGITQFTVPTPGAKAAWITYGTDGGLWFTETHANKIGRITTAGSFREFAIPTANSGANGIQNCSTNCGAHGGVWFAETTANRIGRFNSPL
jgi:hypothetical protein